MKMIESRNKTVHTYMENILEQEFKNIVEEYFPLLKAFYNHMKSKI
jgi:argininosuccinate lyase